MFKFIKKLFDVILNFIIFNILVFKFFSELIIESFSIYNIIEGNVEFRKGKN